MPARARYAADSTSLPLHHTRTCLPAANTIDSGEIAWQATNAIAFSPALRRSAGGKAAAHSTNTRRGSGSAMRDKRSPEPTVAPQPWTPMVFMQVCCNNVADRMTVTHGGNSHPAQ
jgi:hypothetical protein